MRYATAMVLMLVLCVVVPRDPRAGCYWDSDTLRTEATGLPEAVDTIVGRFDRFPDLYYQMRLDRAAKALESNPDLLNELDDAAMASERLGKSDDAVAWLEKKRLALERLKASKGEQDEVYKEHQYRYLANLGTTLAHRWLHDGANREKMEDLRRARDLIAAAIELNPQAHFGREKYQLMAIEWLIEPRRPDWFDVSFFIEGLNPGGVPEPDDRALYVEAEEGVRGLIVLGAAWESVDVFQTYGAIHGVRGDASLWYLALLRVKELRDAGKKSLSPFPPDEDAPGFDEVLSYTPAHDQGDIERFYTKARAEAESWRAARNAYIMERLNRGEHPDTHPEFWNAWREPKRPTAPDGFFGLSGHSASIAKLGIILFAAATGSIVLVVWVMRRVRRARAARLASTTGLVAP